MEEYFRKRVEKQDKELSTLREERIFYLSWLSAAYEVTRGILFFASLILIWWFVTSILQSTLSDTMKIGLLTLSSPFAFGLMAIIIKWKNPEEAFLSHLEKQKRKKKIRED